MKILALEEIHPLKKLAARVLKILKVAGEPDVFLASSAVMRSLKRKYLGIDKDTNVLAFPHPEGFPQPRGKKRLGEIYLSPNYIKRHGESIEFMLIHGLLHLLGFNHEEKGDRIQMEKLEKRLIKLLETGNKQP